MPVDDTSSGPVKVLVERGARGVVTLTLNRADKSNALDAQTVDLLAEAIAAADRDPPVRILALRGAGRHFCAGADVSGGGDGWSGRGTTIVDLCTRLDSLTKPVV